MNFPTMLHSSRDTVNPTFIVLSSPYNKGQCKQAFFFLQEEISGPWAIAMTILKWLFVFGG